MWISAINKSGDTASIFVTQLFDPYLWYIWGLIFATTYRPIRQIYTSEFRNTLNVAVILIFLHQREKTRIRHLLARCFKLGPKIPPTVKKSEYFTTDFIYVEHFETISIFWIFSGNRNGLSFYDGVDRWNIYWIL